MPPKASGKPSSKQKRRSISGRTSRRGHLRLSKPLRAHADLVRKQEWRERIDRNAHGLPNFEMLGLMNRTVSAFMSLPLRMARCRTPRDAWTEQAQLLRTIVADCQSVAFRMMTGAVVPLRQPRSTSGKG
jgi:hypothetical protein